MRSILVTGAGGLLGANLVADYSRLRLPVSGIDHAACDLTDTAATARVIREIDPGYIIHAAALTNVDWCDSHAEETWRVNVEASRALAEIARQSGAGFLYVSTDSVFDGERGQYCETDEPHPLNVYARSKLAGERAVLGANPDAIVVRTVIYGWNLRPKLSYAEWILSCLENGSEVPGFDDAVFSPILVNDLGPLLLALLERRESGIVHVAGAGACTKFEFARAAAEAFGFDAGRVRRASLRLAAMAALRPLNTSLDTSYAARLLGVAMPGVAAGIGRFRAAAKKEQYACV